MIGFSTRRVVAIGEAMVEMAPAGGGIFKQGFAGDTFNTAWHLSQLLVDQADVGFLTRIGTDSFSDSFESELRNDGLDVSVIHRDGDRQMGLYVIELKDAERSFHYWRKDSAARHLADDPEALSSALDGAGLIHVSGITLAILPEQGRRNLIDALAAARLNGAILCFDPNVRPRLWSSQEETRSAMTDLLPIVDIALPSFDDEAALWRDASPEATRSRLLSIGVREIVVKNGAGPVAFFADGELGTLATPRAEGVVDTTGAGDSFNAGYLAARIAGVASSGAVGFAQTLSTEVIRNQGARAPKGAVRSLGATLVEKIKHQNSAQRSRLTVW